MNKQEVILCEGLENSLKYALAQCPHDKVFVLTDEHTHRLCLPLLEGMDASLKMCIRIWKPWLLSGWS